MSSLVEPGRPRTARLTVGFAVALVIASPRSTAEDSLSRAGNAADRFTAGLSLFDAARAHQREHPTDAAATHAKYLESALAFAASWEAGATTSEVATNAANSFAFADRAGQAILWYRRALLVDGGNSRARSGLDHLRLRMPIRSRAAGTATSLANALFFWHDALSFSTRRALCMVLVPLAFLAFAIGRVKRRPFVALGVLLIVPSLALGVSLGLDAASGALTDEAVVVVATQGRRGDGETYGESHSRPFPPGTEVSLTGTRRGEWLEVSLLDGSRSWIRARTLEFVVPRRQEDPDARR